MHQSVPGYCQRFYCTVTVPYQSHTGLSSSGLRQELWTHIKAAFFFSIFNTPAYGAVSLHQPLSVPFPWHHLFIHQQGRHGHYAIRHNFLHICDILRFNRKPHCRNKPELPPLSFSIFLYQQVLECVKQIPDNHNPQHTDSNKQSQ